MLKRLYLNIEEEEEKAYLLGYPLKLTPTEFNLLCALSLNEKLGTDELMDVTGFTNQTKSNIAVHICSINKKAAKISGRKLILNEKSFYCLNEFM